MGTTVRVQCFNVGSMIMASLKTLYIDFMSISTHGGEIEVLQQIPTEVHVRMLVIVLPLANKADLSEVENLAEERNLKLMATHGNIYIFLKSDLLKVVETG